MGWSIPSEWSSFSVAMNSPVCHRARANLLWSRHPHAPLRCQRYVRDLCADMDPLKVGLFVRDREERQPILIVEPPRQIVEIWRERYGIDEPLPVRLATGRVA